LKQGEFSFFFQEFGGFLEAIVASIELERTAIMHEAVENCVAHRVVFEVGIPLLHDAIESGRNIAVQLASLMTNVVIMARTPWIVWERKRSSSPTRSRSMTARSGVSRYAGRRSVAVDESVDLKIPNLVSLKDCLISHGLRNVRVPGVGLRMIIASWLSAIN
jgi:hypothetical protein